jgi:hypothetical protein
MRASQIVFACVFFAGGIQPGWSQRPGDGPTRRIAGYLDPGTGAFRPIFPKSGVNPRAEPDVTPTTGKLVFDFNITVSSSFPAGEVISCSVIASVYDFTNNVDIAESAGAAATVSGSKATCTVTIPYSWPLADPGSETVGLSYEILATPANGASLTRYSTRTLASIPVPATGATTTQTINARI